MYIKLALAMSICFLTLVSNAQIDDINQVLNSIEQNNLELKVLTEKIENQKVELSTVNNLSDPELSGYFMPFGEHSTGNYSEVQISQSFEFPTIYKSRKDLIVEQETQFEIAYELKKQRILLEAKIEIIQLVALNKKLVEEKEKVQQAKVVFEHTQILLDKGQIGVLDLNKSKLNWIQMQFLTEKTENSIREKQSRIRSLNGGNEIIISRSNYFENLEIQSLDSLWNNKLDKSPQLKLLVQKEKVAEKQLLLAKQNRYPDLQLGYNYQGVLNENYSGVYAGISIPIWSNKNKVKSADLNLNYTKSYSDFQIQMLKSDFEIQYYNYKSLLKRYVEYSSTFSSLNSLTMLTQVYKSGELSFSEYYMETSFYYEAYSTMLNMEKELHQLKAELLKHQL